MWSEGDGVQVWSPPPKPLFWIFVPTVLGGVLGLLTIGAGLIRFVFYGEQVFPSMMQPILQFPFCLWMAAGGTIALSGRTRFIFDTRSRTVTDRFTSLLWSRARKFAFADVRAVRVATVGRSRSTENVDLVGAYRMVLLVGDSGKLLAQLWSANDDSPVPLAHRVSALLGVPVEVA